MTKTIYTQRTKLQGLYPVPTNGVRASFVGKGHASVVKPVYGYAYPLASWSHGA